MNRSPKKCIRVKNRYPEKQDIEQHRPTLKYLASQMPPMQRLSIRNRKTEESETVKLKNEVVEFLLALRFHEPVFHERGEQIAQRPSFPDSDEDSVILK